MLGGTEGGGQTQERPSPSDLALPSTETESTVVHQL